jgi:hypothetical protein
VTGKTEGKCTDWKAWHDNQPPGPARLYVTGKCTFPTNGYKVELKPHVPQGINPAIYILDKVVNKPSGPAEDVITTVEVRYEEKTSKHYTEVNILPNDVHVDVKEVQ